MENKESIICRRPRATRSQAGFTLIEILVVLIIISIVSLIVIPRIRISSPASLLRSEIRHFVRYVKYLRGMSATENILHKLYIDLDNGKYWAVYIDENGEEQKALEDLLPEVKIDETVKFREVRTPGKLPATEGSTSVIFYGNGEVEGAEIVFETGSDKTVTLKIHPLTGRCTIWKENPE